MMPAQLNLNLDPSPNFPNFETGPPIRKITIWDSDLEGDTLREECGVFGIFGHPDAAAITALGLHALAAPRPGSRRHRLVRRQRGFIPSAGSAWSATPFPAATVIDRLPGTAAVGHVRYSTTGETILRNVQPLFAELNAGGFAVGHNGNLTNGLTLAPRTGAQRRHDAVHHRHRSDPASGRAVQAQPLHRPLHRSPAHDRRRLFAGVADQQETDRGP